MKCAWCRKRVWFWQDRSPVRHRLEWVGTSGRFEHKACQNVRYSKIG